MRKAPRTPHPDKVLAKASDYLEVDLHSFAATYEMLALNLVPKASEIRNAVIDSFLIRARLLIDFFLSDAGLQDDVLAIDYFHDRSPRPYKPRMTKQVQRERQKINKRLVHLTTEPMPRLRSTQHYDARKIVPPVVRAVKKWLSVVPEHRLQTGVRKDYLRHIARIERVMHQVRRPG